APGMAEDGTLWRSPAPVSGVGSALAGLSLRRLEEEPEVPADGEGEPPVGSPPAVGTIAWAKTRPDGTQVTLSDVVLTRSFASLNSVSGYFYVTEEPTLPHQRTGTMGLRVAGAPPTENPQDQRRLSLQGTMATLETGERVLVPSYIEDPDEPAQALPPLHVTMRALFCGDLISAEQGAVVVPGPAGGTGAHLVGCFVGIRGHVSVVGEDCFTIWDGSARWDGTELLSPDGAKGVLVEAPEGLFNTILHEGDLVSVHGILSLKSANGQLYPVVLMGTDLWGRDASVECEGTAPTLEFAEPAALVDVCQPEISVRVRLSSCGLPLAHRSVTLTTTLGEFAESQSQTVEVLTSADGSATVTLLRPSQLPHPESARCNTAFLQASFGGDERHNPVAATGEVIFDRWKLVVTALPGWMVRGDAIPVKVRLTRSEGTPVAGQPITLTATGGSLNGETSVVLTTDSDGEAEAVLSVPADFGCAGTVTVHGSALASPCGEEYTDSDVVRVLCQQPASVDVFFCIDWSESMSDNHPRSAVARFCQLVEAALANRSIPVRFGGLRFNDEDGINPTQVRSLALGLSASAFADFLDFPYAAASGNEMQWSALHLAVQDCVSNSGANRLPFIVLITDEVVSLAESLPRDQLMQELEASGIPVFISVWEDQECLTTLRSFYDGVNVNGGKFDPVDYLFFLQQPYTEENMYPFHLLRAAVAGVTQ
ncbi:MAG: hypothetical protein ACUVS8_10560, partial [Armatimonadota bacterium]